MTTTKGQDIMSKATSKASKGKGSAMTEIPRPVVVKRDDTPKRYGEPQRTVRVDDETWSAGKAQAAADGTTLSAVIRYYVRAYAGLEPGTIES